MSTDDRDNDSPGDKKPPAPKQVVVTHYGKKKKDSDVPNEIMPTEPTHIISSPVDIGTAMPKPSPVAQQTEQKPGVRVTAQATPTPAPTATVKQATTAPTATVTQPPAPEPKVTLEKPIPQVEPKREVFPPAEPLVATAASFSAKQAPEKETYGSGGGYIPPEEPEQRQRPPSGGGGGGALFFSVISLFAVIVLGYYAYSTYQQLTELQQQSSNDQTSVMALTEQTKKTLTQIQEQSTKAVTEQQALEDLRKQLTSAQANLVTLSGNTDWVLAEANYLAFMANERLKTAQDVTTALAQLNSADERISRLGNPALLWVREAMAKDIAKLRNFPAVNRQAIWEQLGLIDAEFNQLHFKSVLNGKPSEIKAEQEDASMSAWQKGLWRTWQELKSIIKITHVAENTIPLALTTQEQAQILRTLHFMNEQARWAILQGENKVYQQSLQSIKAWLNEYFAQDKMQSDLLTQIAQLEQQNITIDVPEISDSVQALSKAMLEVVNKPTTKSPL